MGCNQSKIACGCGNHIVDRDGKEYCLPSCQTEVSIKKAERELRLLRARQLLAVKRGHLTARGFKGGRPPDIRRDRQAPMKPTKNFLGIDTVEAIFDRLLPTVVNGKQVRPSLPAENTTASTDKETKLENHDDAHPENITTSGSPLEPCNQENQKKEAVKRFVNSIFRNALDEVRTEQFSVSPLTEQSLPQLEETRETSELIENVNDETVVPNEIKNKVKAFEEPEVLNDDHLSMVLVKWEDVKVSVDAEVKIGPEHDAAKDNDEQDAFETEPEILKDDQLSMALVNWEDVKVSVDAEVKIGPEHDAAKDNDEQDAFDNKPEVLKDDQLSIVLVNWEDVKVSVDAEVKMGPEHDVVKDNDEQDAFDNKPEVLKDDQLSIVLVNWEDVKVSVDAEVKMGPEHDVVKDNDEQDAFETEPEILKDDQLSMALVNWEDVKVSVDAEVKMGPEHDVVKDNDEQDAFETEAEVLKDDQHSMVLVKWEDVKVSVDAEVKMGPEHDVVKDNDEQDAFETEPEIVKDDQLSMALVNWEDVKVSVDAEVKIGPEHDAAKDNDEQDAFDNKPEVLKDDQLSIVLVNWEDVKVSVDAEVKMGPEHDVVKDNDEQDAFDNKPEVLKDDQLSIVLVNWEDVKVSVDAEVKMGPEHDVVKDNDEQDAFETEPEILKDDQLSMALVNWEDVKVSVDAEVKMGPEHDVVKDNDEQDAFETEAEVLKDDQHSMVLVKWEDVKVSVDAEVKMGPEHDVVKDNDEQDAFETEPEIVKDDQLSMALVNWEDVKVSVDAEVKMGPEHDIVKDNEEQSAPSEEVESMELKDDHDYVIVSLDQVKVDAPIKVSPEAMQAIAAQNSFTGMEIEENEDLNQKIPCSLIETAMNEAVEERDDVPTKLQAEQTMEKTGEIHLTIVQWQEVKLSVDAEMKRAHTVKQVKSENSSSGVKETPAVDKIEALSNSMREMCIKPEDKQEHDVVEKQGGENIHECHEGLDGQEGQLPGVHQHDFVQANADFQVTGAKKSAVAMGTSYALTCSPEDASPMATALSITKASEGNGIGNASGEAVTGIDSDDATDAAMDNGINVQESIVVPVKDSCPRNERLKARDDEMADDNAQDIMAQDIDKEDGINGQQKEKQSDEQDEEVLIPEFLPVFIDTGKDSIDHTSRDVSTPLAGNEVLALLSTVMTDEDIMNQIARSDSCSSLEEVCSSDQGIKQMDRQIHDEDNEEKTTVIWPDDGRPRQTTTTRRKEDLPNNGDNAETSKVDGLNLKPDDYRPSENTKTSNEKCITKNNNVCKTKPRTGETTIARPSDGELSETAEIIEKVEETTTTHGVRGKGDAIGGPANGNISQVRKMESLEEDTRGDGTEREASIARPGNASCSKAHKSEESNEKISRDDDEDHGEASNARPGAGSSSRNASQKYAVKNESTNIEKPPEKIPEYDAGRNNCECEARDHVSEGCTFTERHQKEGVISSDKGRSDKQGSRVTSVIMENNPATPLQEVDYCSSQTMDETRKKLLKNTLDRLELLCQEFDDIATTTTKCDKEEYEKIRSCCDKDKQVTEEDKLQSGSAKNQLEETESITGEHQSESHRLGIQEKDSGKGQKVARDISSNESEVEKDEEDRERETTVPVTALAVNKLPEKEKVPKVVSAAKHSIEDISTDKKDQIRKTKGQSIDDSVSLRPMGNWSQRFAAQHPQKDQSNKGSSMDRSSKVYKSINENIHGIEKTFSNGLLNVGKDSANKTNHDCDKRKSNDSDKVNINSDTEESSCKTEKPKEIVPQKRKKRRRNKKRTLKDSNEAGNNETDSSYGSKNDQEPQQRAHLTEVENITEAAAQEKESIENKIESEEIKKVEENSVTCELENANIHSEKEDSSCKTENSEEIVPQKKKRRRRKYKKRTLTDSREVGTKETDSSSGNKNGEEPLQQAELTEMEDITEAAEQEKESIKNKTESEEIKKVDGTFVTCELENANIHSEKEDKSCKIENPEEIAPQKKKRRRRKYKKRTLTDSSDAGTKEKDVSSVSKNDEEPQQQAELTEMEDITETAEQDKESIENKTDSEEIKKVDGTTVTCELENANIHSVKEESSCKTENSEEIVPQKKKKRRRKYKKRTLTDSSEAETKETDSSSGNKNGEEPLQQAELTEMEDITEAAEQEKESIENKTESEEIKKAEGNSVTCELENANIHFQKEDSSCKTENPEEIVPQKKKRRRRKYKKRTLTDSSEEGSEEKDLSSVCKNDEEPQQQADLTEMEDITEAAEQEKESIENKTESEEIKKVEGTFVTCELENANIHSEKEDKSCKIENPEEIVPQKKKRRRRKYKKRTLTDSSEVGNKEKDLSSVWKNDGEPIEQPHLTEIENITEAAEQEKDFIEDKGRQPRPKTADVAQMLYRNSEEYDGEVSSPGFSSVESQDYTLFEKEKKKMKKDSSWSPKECDVEDIKLAIQEFNNVRQVLGLDGPVSTALVYKFLHARERDVDDATRLYKNYLSLRRVYYNRELDPLKGPLQRALFSGGFTVLDARDESGAAIALVTAKLHKIDISHEVAVNNIYLQLDEAIKSLEIQRNGMFLIYNFSNVSYKTCDVLLCSKILDLFQSAYPVRVKKTFIVSPPFWFEPEMRLFSASFRDANKRKNIHIVTQSKLKSHLPVTCIPRGLGGECQANPMRLIELCISSHKERMGLIDIQEEGSSNSGEEYTMSRQDQPQVNIPNGERPSKSAEKLENPENDRDLGVSIYNTT